MRVAIIGFNLKDRYSGGRIHAWLIAQGLGLKNVAVDYYTNNIPVFSSEYNYSENVNIVRINNLYKYIFSEYQIVFIVPHLKSRKSFFIDRFIFYPFAYYLKIKSNCKIIYIDFESPNWINEMLPGIRPYSAYHYSDLFIKHVDIILSTTNIGREYAKKYYGIKNTCLEYEQLYLCINQKVADSIAKRKKENKIVFFARFQEKYKKSEDLFTVIKAIPDDYELIVIGVLSHEQKNRAFSSSCDNNINIEFYEKITEKQKYEILNIAKLLIYSTGFEGYGLPPIEAQYMNTPVLCSDIPVIREVNKKAYYSDFNDVQELRELIVLIVNNNIESNSIKESVMDKASVNIFSENLIKIVQKYI